MYTKYGSLEFFVTFNGMLELAILLKGNLKLVVSCHGIKDFLCTCRITHRCKLVGEYVATEKPNNNNSVTIQIDDLPMNVALEFSIVIQHHQTTSWYYIVPRDATFYRVEQFLRHHIAQIEPSATSEQVMSYLDYSHHFEKNSNTEQEDRVLKTTGTRFTCTRKAHNYSVRSESMVVIKRSKPLSLVE